jgi:hypothetical protein
MKIDLLFRSEMFSVAELSAMCLSYELFRYYGAYAPFGFVETPAIRASYLLLTTGKRARAHSKTSEWVMCGGNLPVDFDLVDNR